MARTQACPVHKVTGLLGKRWTIPLVEEVAGGTTGFNALSRRLRTVTPKVLSQRLRQLEAEGIIAKQDNNPHPRYTLTARGKRLQDLIKSLKTWSEVEHTHIKGCSARNCMDCPMYA